MKRVYLVKNHRSVWGVLIVLIGYGSNGNRYSERERLEWIVYCSITNINLQRQLLAVYQFWAILSLGKKESVIVSAVILAHASGKQEKIKAVLVLKRLSRVQWTLDATVIGWMAEVQGGTVVETGCDDFLSRIGCMTRKGEDLEWGWDGIRGWYLWYAEKTITCHICVITCVTR